MGLRYRKRVSIAPGVKLNISRSGVSTSLKVGNVTVNPHRQTAWVNLPGGFFYQKSLRSKPHAKPTRRTQVKVEWKPTAVELVSTHHGLLWHEAPIPSRWHHCRPWTVGRTMEQQLVDYCACGAVRMNGLDPWYRRNSRRRK